MSESRKTAVVFEVREFCLHDGPGVRTTVFFKGCPLRCTWCHNPEGLSPEPEMLFKERQCRHCGNCGIGFQRTGQSPSLPCEAIREGRASSRPLDDATIERLERVCPQRARVVCGRRWTVDELAAELLSNADVFDSSGGGITFSGGEPLMQADFLELLVARLRAERPVHLAMETSGYAAPEAYRKVVSGIDLLFQDLKHPDPQAHKRWTGVDPAPIHANLRWLKSTGRPFVARIPLIPGVNDSDEAKEGFARLLEGPSGMLRVELLPYHLTAAAKYPYVGRRYDPGFDESKSPDANTEIFRRHGLEAVVM